MENATDALKMAFAMFIFITALAVAFSLIAKIKTTADSIMFTSDKTNYYTWETGSLKNGREVGVDTIISTLYNQPKDTIYVRIGNQEFSPSRGNNEVEAFLKELKEEDKKALYYEDIYDIIISGEYITADDGTKLYVGGNSTTRTYVTYTKK